MIKRATLGILILAGSLVAAGCTKTETPTATDTTLRATPTEQSAATPTTNPATTASDVLTGTVAVTIQNFAFAPATIKVKKGTTVVWTNQDTVKHNAHSLTAGGPQGPLIGKGENYSFTFNQLGTFNYICQPHPNMKGSVEVVE